MALVLDQMVLTTWNNRFAKYYISKGYKKLKPQQKFEVKIEDLPEKSNVEVVFICDTCGEKDARSYNQLQNQELHFCSKDCRKNHSKHDKEFLVKEFYRYYEENGKYPQQNDMQAQKGYPSHYYYTKLWGNWDSFIKEMDIYDSGRWLKKDVETLKRMYENYPKEDVVNSLTNNFSWIHIGEKARSLGLKRKYKAPSKKAYNKEFLIKEFWRYYEEKEIYPYKKDMTKSKEFPSESGYIRIWGSWENFLKDIEVVAKDNTDGWYICDENIVKTMYEYSPKEDIIDSLMVKRTWGTIVFKASKLGVKRNSKTKQIFTNECLLLELKNFYAENNKVPTCGEFEKSDMYPSPTLYQKRFGSWNNALKEAGLELNTNFNYKKEDIVNEARLFYSQNNRSPYYYELSYSKGIIDNNWGNWTKFLIDCNLPLNREIIEYSKEESIQLLKDLAESLNRVPVKSDLESLGLHKEWYSIRFDSFRNALYEAGLITKEELEIDYETYKENNIKYLIELSNELQRIPTVQEYELYLSNKTVKDYLARETLSRRLKQSYLEICQTYLRVEILNSPLNNKFINKKGEICRSLPEMNISNLFIDNNLDYSYEPYYKDVMPISENYRFDWKIAYNDLDLYIEYFGFFDENNDSYNLIHDYNVKTIRKIKLCEDNKINLISLYPDDLNDNYKGLIEKFNKNGVDINIY